ncbi:MAG: hypothetical protein AAFZ38_12055 [Myxococcota bacterium]
MRSHQRGVAEQSQGQITPRWSSDETLQPLDIEFVSLKHTPRKPLIDVRPERWVEQSLLEPFSPDFAARTLAKLAHRGAEGAASARTTDLRAKLGEASDVSGGDFGLGVDIEVLDEGTVVEPQRRVRVRFDVAGSKAALEESLRQILQ